ncbi:MAG: hypothetical protein LUG91_07535 [Ruminococcus sp.]|nr:hypothetical protein [Ruminococcus sp.]
MNKYQQFRSSNPVFLYKSYHIVENADKINVSYDFEIPALAEFHPKWSFPKPASCSVTFSDSRIFEQLVFSLGMAEAISYWKSTCSPELRVECGELSAEQAQWWKKLYFMGLGEFFYVNKIDADFDSFVTINSCGRFRCEEKSLPREPQGCLVPIGGGKDSALTIEALKNAGVSCKCYSINSRRSISETVRAAGLDESTLITAGRIFDRSLIGLNNKGYFNGHTPFSAIVAFSAEITAHIHGLKYIVLSNESSANESTVAGRDVNHQYSKSFEFEKDFHYYEEKFLGTGAYYFSFLRPLTEFQIAKMFVSYEKYLPIFRSCNLGSKVSPDIWCADCPKCLFVCLILSPFVSRDRLLEIFGRDLLDEPEMLPYFEQLTGQAEHKPFECVGSVNEVKLAVSLAIRSSENSGLPLPLLFEKFKESGLYHPEQIDGILRKYYSSYDEHNLLPDEFKIILQNEMERIF